MKITYFVWALYLIKACSAAYKIVDTGSPVLNLWADYELRLRDAVQETIVNDESEQTLRKTRSVDSHTWTGFVPNLYQRRDQLELDTVEVLPATLICRGQNVREKPVLDSMQYRRSFYTVAACGKGLSLYGVNSTNQFLLDYIITSKNPIKITHVKLYDTTTGDLRLFVLVLTEVGVDVFSIEEKRLKLSFTQELATRYSSQEIFYENGGVYCMLLAAASADETSTNLFKLELINNKITFTLMTSSVVVGASERTRTCSVNGGAYIMQPSYDSKRLNLYRLDEKNVEFFQVLEAPDIQDYDCFRIGFGYFLVIGTSSSIKFYEYDSGFFNIIQEVSRAGLKNVKAFGVPTDSNDAVVLVKGYNTKDFFELWVYDSLSLEFKPLHFECSHSIDWEVPTPKRFNSSNLGCLNDMAFTELRSSSSLHLEDTLVISLPNDRYLWLVKVDVRMRPVESPVLRELLDTQKRIEAAASSARAIEDRSREFSEFSKGIVLYGSDVKLEGAWNIGTVAVPSLEIDALKTDQVNFNDNIWIPGLDTIVNDLEKKMEELENSIAEVKHKLKGVVLNGTEAALTFNELEVNGELLIDRLKAVEVSLDNLNGQPFNSLVSDFVRKDSNRLINALRIVGSLTSGSLQADFINDIPTKDIVINNDYVAIDGNLIIGEELTVEGNVTVSGTVNGLDLSRQLITSDNQAISVNFTGPLYADNLSVNGFVDSVNLSYLLSNVVLKDTDAPSFGDIQFEQLIIEGDLNIASGMIDGVNFTALNESVLRLNANEYVESRLEFHKVIMNDSLEVSSINGIPFGDFILKSSNIANLTLTGRKTFDAETTVNTVVTKLVNGNAIEDIITLDTDQAILSPINFSKGFEVGGDLVVEKINNVAWKRVREIGLHPAILEQEDVAKDVTFSNNCAIKGALDSSQVKVGSENLKTLLDDLVYKDEDHVEITGKKSLASLSAGKLRVDGYVNGKKLLAELLTSNTDQLIEGRYEFNDEVSFSNLKIEGNLNDYNVVELLGSVLRVDELDQPVECQLKFENLAVNGWINVDGTINGVSPDQILFDGVDQTFTAPQTLVSPEFVTLTIDGNLALSDSATLVNGMDLDLFDRKRATKSTDQWINADWHLTNASISSMSLRKLNNLTLNDWRDKFLRIKSSTQQVIKTSDLRIDTVLEITGNVTTLGKGINGYDWQAFSRDAGDIRGPITFKTDVTFESLEAERLRVSRTFNGASLEELASDAVFRDLNQNITGVKKFSTLRVMGDVNSELVNDARLIESYLHKSANQRIEAPIRFTGKLAAEDVDLSGDAATLNGVPRDLLFSSQTRPYNVHLGDVVIEKPVDVKSLHIQSLFDENWDELLSSIAYVDRPNNFSETIHFTKPVKFNAILTADLVNDVDLRLFSEEVVSKNAPAVITGKKIFENLETGDLLIHQLAADSVSPDIIATSKNAIYLNSTTPISRTVHFKKLRIEGNISAKQLNGEKFPDGYLLLDGDQHLGGTHSIKQLVMDGNISFAHGARINGFDSEAECANTWMIDGSERIKSTKVFHGKVQFLRNMMVQKVNDIPNFGQEVVKLSEGGTIHGAPEWKEVTVMGNVIGVGLTNDVNLTALADQALYVDTPISTNAKWTSKKVSVTNGQLLLPVEATLNGESFAVGRLLGENESARLSSLKVEDKKTYKAALSWHDALRKAYFKMEYLALDQTLVLQSQVTALNETSVNGTSLLLVGTRNGSAIFSRKANESSYTLAKIMPDVNHTKTWVAVPGGYISSTSLLGSKFWQITSLEPFALKEIQKPEENIKGFTDSTALTVELMNSTSGLNSSASSKWLTIYEKSKTSNDSLGKTLPSSMDIVVHEFRLGSKLMIALVPTFPPEVVASVVGCPGVRIFSAHSMRLEHIIQACDVRAVNSFSHGNFPDHYLLLAAHEAVFVYHYEGASGFVERFRLPYHSASAIHSWNVGSRYESETLVAVGKEDRVMIHKAVTIGEYIRD